VVTSNEISKLYGDNQDLFKSDFENAKKEHREKRLYEIRNKGKKPFKYSPAESQISEGKFMIWFTYFADEEILEEIEKDIKRTRSEMSFFCNALDPENNTPQNTERLIR